MQDRQPVAHRIDGDPAIWRALGHPLRQKIRAHLDAHGPATATLVAKACGLNTGTASYHLRILGAAGLIEDDPTQSDHGRQRWWRPVSVDLREPGPRQLDPAERRALDEWRATQLPSELALAGRFLAEFRDHGDWARASRSRGWFTEQGLRDLMDAYVALLTRHSHPGHNAPADARRMDLRMFFLPVGENDPADGPDLPDSTADDHDAP